MPRTGIYPRGRGRGRGLGPFLLATKVPPLLVNWKRQRYNRKRHQNATPAITSPHQIFFFLSYKTKTARQIHREKLANAVRSSYHTQRRTRRTDQRQYRTGITGQELTEFDAEQQRRYTKLATVANLQSADRRSSAICTFVREQFMNSARFFIWSFVNPVI